jgi:Homeodomain-like domain
MPKPVPIPVRRKLLERAQRGESTAGLAAAFGLAPRTVRHLLKRFRDRGPDGVSTDYRTPGDLPHAYPDRVRQAALALRREHPTWGAVLIWVALGQRRPEDDRPSPSTLRRWSRDAGLAPAPPSRRAPQPRSGRATAPHDTWQMDASEQIPLADGTRACWLRVVDEASGAVLGTAVFPPGRLAGGRSAADPGDPAAAVRPLGPARAGAGR